jgi:hypothetical protein
VGEDGGLIAGHARVLAARQLGIAEIPVMVAAGWSEAQKRAYVLADNQLAITGSGWDPELLRLELGELKLGGFDLSLTGFGDLELKDLLADRTDGLTDPDDAPAVPEHPVSQAGDLWCLGRHRLLCGDSTVATDVERVLGGVEPHLMVTDPPYGVSYAPKWRETSLKSRKKPRSLGIVENDDRADWREAWALFPGEAAYVWHAGTKAAIVQESLEACGLFVRTQIIWAKQHFVIGRGHYPWLATNQSICASRARGDKNSRLRLPLGRRAGLDRGWRRREPGPRPPRQPGIPSLCLPQRDRHGGKAMTEAPARLAGFWPATFAFFGELCVSDYDAGAGPPTVTSTRRSWPGVGSLVLSPCPLTTSAL